MINAKAEENVVTLNLHSEIGASWFKSDEREEGACEDVEDLKKILDENKNASRIDIYINSAGGSVSEGIAIYNILKRTRAYKRVFIDGFACSIASVIAMAGNSITMPKSSMQMIHNAWCVAMGNAKELRKVADDLETINEVVVNAYMTKFKGSREELKALLDEEKYLTAEQCYEYGLCTKIVDDSEETEEAVADGIDKNTGLLANKLKELEAIKNAIKEIDGEHSELESSKEAKVEYGKEDEEGNELDCSKMAKVTKEELEEKVAEEKATALQEFFGYKPDEIGKEN